MSEYRKLRRILRTTIVCAGVLWVPVALAQTYPARPVRIIAPFPAGGGTDIFARMIAKNCRWPGGSRRWWTTAPGRRA